MSLIVKFFKGCGFFFFVTTWALNGGIPWPKPPSTISTPSVDAASPDLAVDANGRAIGVWIENGLVVSSQKLFQQPWSTPLVTISDSGASSPYVVVDPNGLVTAIWLQNGALMTANQPLNGSWSLPVILAPSGISQAQMAMDKSGNIVAVWQTSGIIQSSTQLIGGSWQATPDTLSGAGAASPSISIGDNGTVCAVWEQTGNQIYAISKTINGTWGTASQISSPGVQCTAPDVAVNGLGDTIVGWFRFELNGSNYSNVVVQSAYQPSNGAWSTPVDVSGAGSIDPAQLTLSVAGGSNIDVALMAWTNSYGLSLFNVEYAIFRSGQWQPSVSLVSNNLMAYSVDLSRGLDDDIYISYMYWDSTQAASVIDSLLLDLSIQEQLAGTVWQLSISGMNAYPDVSLNLSGTSTYGTCVWLNYEGHYNAVQTIVSKLPVLQPPTQFSAVQQSTNYGIFTQYSNVVSWTPSVSPQTVGYVLSRNGLQLAILYSPTASQFVDVNRLPQETVTYTIYAFDTYGCVSTKITQVFTPP